MPIVAISQQYDTPQSTFYYWLSRYEEYYTYENRSSAPHCTHGKVTEEIRVAVLEKHSRNRLLGCWRLSLFLYQEQSLSHTTIWRILVAARQPRKLSQPLYHLTHCHQIWFIDHMHLRTLPDGQKVYSLVIVDGMSRVILSDEVCLSKDARDAVLILLRAFARWGLPEEILSDNGGAFISMLYQLFLARFQVKVSHTTPGHPWENGYAESLIGTFRAYMYPHIGVAGGKLRYDAIAMFLARKISLFVFCPGTLPRIRQFFALKCGNCGEKFPFFPLLGNLAI